MPAVLSLCDYSGRWALPYLEAGYEVILVDPKHGDGCRENTFKLQEQGYTVLPCTVASLLLSREWMQYLKEKPELGILMAPPCTDFSVSGAQYWPAKDADGRTEDSVLIVTDCLKVAKRLQPRWWALENPVGRLPKLVPELGKPWYFQPHWYGDPWTKKTGLWGDFNRDLPRNDVEPIRYTKQGSWTQRYGGKSERTKEARSMTPLGFARAFFQANP